MLAILVPGCDAVRISSQSHFASSRDPVVLELSTNGTRWCPPGARMVCVVPARPPYLTLDPEPQDWGMGCDRQQEHCWAYRLAVCQEPRDDLRYPVQEDYLLSGIERDDR